MAPSRTDTLHDLFAPWLWTLPVAILLHGQHLESSGTGAFVTVLLLAALGAVSFAVGRRLVPASPVVAIMTAVLCMGHPATSLALQSGQAMSALAPTVALLLAAAIRLAPSEATHLKRLGNREVMSMLLCAVAAALDVASAFGAALLWILDISYDRGPFSTVAERWKRVVWGFAVMTFPAWWTVSGAAPAWAASGFSGAACITLCVPPSAGAIEVMSILLPISALATSAFIRQRHARPRAFGIAVGMGLCWILLAIVPGAIMGINTPPVLAAFGMAWIVAVGLNQLGQRLRNALDVGAPTLAPIPSVPGLRDLVRNVPSAPFPAPLPGKTPVVMDAAGVHAAVETAVSGAVAGVLKEIRALVPPRSEPTRDGESLLWEQLQRAPFGIRSAPWSSASCSDVAMRIPPGSRVWIDSSQWPELTKALVQRGISVVLSLRGAAQARAAAHDWSGVDAVHVVRAEDDVGAAMSDASFDVALCLLTCDGRTAADVVRRLKELSRLLVPRGQILLAFTDLASPEIRAVMAEGNAVPALSHEMTRTCAEIAGLEVDHVATWSAGRSALWLKESSAS